MTAQLISNADDKYLVWARKNPHGFVLNIASDNNPKYRVLHRATCRPILEYQADKPAGAFTCRKYRKVVAQEVQELTLWVASNRGGAIKCCKLCNPPPPPATMANLAAILEREVKESLADPTARRARLAAASGKPAQFEVTITAFRRSADVIAEVLEQAQGTCGLCNKPGPFRRNDGTFYLEVHHRIRLADGGEDTVANAVACCPNCHRKAHYGKAL